MILKAEDVQGQALDHLGIVASVISRLKLVEKIDARLPVSKEKGAKVTMGQRVAAMILNGLGFTDDRLYLFPEFLKNKPVERLLGEGLKASDFNDDASGRCLDEITNYGTTPLFTEIAFEVGLAEDLLGTCAHFDTTSLSVFGEYEREDASESFNITHGHSKAHRPDLKQMVLNLATTGAHFPIWMEAHSGNASDKKILEGGASRMQSFCNLLKSAPAFLYVGDSAFYERCVKEEVTFKWLSRVPERLKAAKQWIEQPKEALSWTALHDGYSMTTLAGAGYGDVPQRWVMIHSEKAMNRESKTLEKHIEKEREALTKVLWHLGNQVFKCSDDAQTAGLDGTKSLKYHRVSWVITAVEKHAGRGRPKEGVAPMIRGYRIQGSFEQDDETVELMKRRKGRFILATNELESSKLAEQDFLVEYKKQYKTEQSFAFIKGNAFEVSSIFLKKPTQTPSMSWVFRLFQGIQLWLVPTGRKVNELVVNLSALTRRIIGYFGQVAERIYASSG